MTVQGVSYSPTQPVSPQRSIGESTGSTAAETIPSSHASKATPTSNDPPKLSLLHKFITNWLIMDPALLDKYKHTYEENVVNSSTRQSRRRRHIRNYQIQKHKDMKYIYFFGGRFRTIKAMPITILTGAAIVIPSVLFWIFEASWIWHNIHPAAVIMLSYICWLCFMFYFKSSTSDPGVVPRNIHIPKSLTSNTVKLPPEEYFNTISLPGHNHCKVQVKYCPTCHIWRPPRTSHCSVCQACIISHDHHCVYLNNCIGERNYRYFLWFLLTAVLSCLYMLIITIVHLCYYRIVSSDITTFGHSVKKYPVALLLFIYSVLALIYPFLLLLFHIFLTAQNLTTREYLNYVYKRRNNTYVNVFDTHNIFKNLYINWLGKSSGVALVRPRDKYEPGDLRFEQVLPLELFTKES
ncbi:uncharacterized protein SPAPADRAFT_58097 [Spathaspora passalidarum NRRL Y-27907]|uniref:Palmitoyltransferase n=1 Tax=Spathaspora passalidarum (strain NRRL Y-27907 / 11-Y1) TaxID=619300 RepID=G3AFI4_SPAPN|nr:uncharacterized protein SPAPADRAFT_58097 [Spathaspora passalidarum NRRL Y-27907]EGW34973.1 hypothetical protein SPAPADRAFT_58097 [Spathaspora passalidarum NRRL Y-27907]